MAALPAEECGSISILEEETGGGKTEAALARFVKLFETGLVDGLYFALPTRTAATQIHRRVQAAVSRAFWTRRRWCSPVPGYLMVDDVSGERLAPFDVLWNDSDAERFRYRGWAAENAKRYLSGAVVVGTIDQVLLSSLMVSHAHLRATALLRHLLVVDEVHASDAYMGRILEHVLQRHRAAGGHALLLSATLAGEARFRLLNPGVPSARPGLQEAKRKSYPLLSHRGAEARGIPVPPAGRNPSSRRRRQTRDEPTGSREAMALDAAAQGAKVLVIRNTVTDCVATQLALETAAAASDRTQLLFACQHVPAPHHSRFARADRAALDAALEARLGRTRPDGGCVVVATQTVQQSLDIDADLLLSDLCPSDVLLQRMGRLHRHARPRPESFGTPETLVLVPDRIWASELRNRVRPAGPTASAASTTICESSRPRGA